MIKRYRYWLLPIALAGILALAALGGVALAQTGSDGDQPANAPTQAAPPWAKFSSRVAQILGKDEAETLAAFHQAAREQHEEALKAKLDGLVATGKLTQEQADSYLAWLKSRPADLPPMLGIHGFGGPHLKGHDHDWGHFKRHFGPPGKGGWLQGGDKPIYQVPPPTATPES